MEKRFIFSSLYTFWLVLILISLRIKAGGSKIIYQIPYYSHGQSLSQFPFYENPNNGFFKENSWHSKFYLMEDNSEKWRRQHLQSSDENDSGDENDSEGEDDEEGDEEENTDNDNEKEEQKKKKTIGDKIFDVKEKFANKYVDILLHIETDKQSNEAMQLWGPAPEIEKPPPWRNALFRFYNNDNYFM